MDYPEKYEIESYRFSGFIAQEVEDAAKASGYAFSGVGVPKNEKDFYSLRYATFVVPLVKAVQQLSDKNNALTKILKDTHSMVGRLQEAIDTLKTENTEIKAQLIVLQNAIEESKD